MSPLDDIDELRGVLDEARAALPGEIDRAATLVRAALARPGGKVLACGNGGSAASAQHFVAELVGRYRLDRPPMAALALVADAVTLTALANDTDFSRVFARQVEALAGAGDVLVALSTRGRSPNVVRAAQTARSLGCAVIALTGRAPGGDLAALADAAIFVPSDSVARIQEVHALALHALARALEGDLTGG